MVPRRPATAAHARAAGARAAGAADAADELTTDMARLRVTKPLPKPREFVYIAKSGRGTVHHYKHDCHGYDLKKVSIRTAVDDGADTLCQYCEASSK